MGGLVGGEEVVGLCLLLDEEVVYLYDLNGLHFFGQVFHTHYCGVDDVIVWRGIGLMGSATKM